MRVTIIGAGNVATHLAKVIYKAGHKIINIWNRNFDGAYNLAKLYDAYPVKHFSELSDTDIIIISVSDDAINEVILNIDIANAIIVHTAGSVSIDILEKFGENRGVFYPLQTFSKQIDVDFTKIPIIIEANNQNVLEKLSFLANSISNTVKVLSSEKRKYLHIAAVFSCNFTNHMYTIASNLLKINNLDFQLIEPLIELTNLKIKDNEPSEIQTGPAVRNDINVIDEHLKLLNNLPDIQFIYKTLSNDIVKMYHSKLP